MRIRSINLIGQEIEIVESNNKTLIGIKGRVIDETRNTLTIESHDKVRKVLKKEVKFKINTSQSPIIDGKDVVGRPEKRIKKKNKVKKRW